jgi:quercetin dioxygenase-like cupin family protein
VGPGNRLGWHDHDGSSGALHVLRGALAETYADTEVIASVMTRELAAGATVAVPATRVHSVENASASEAVSLHVYSPPLGGDPTMRS